MYYNQKWISNYLVSEGVDRGRSWSDKAWKKAESFVDFQDIEGGTGFRDRFRFWFRTSRGRI